MMNWTSMASQKGVTVVTAWPVNHLQSAFFSLFIAWCVKIGTLSVGGFKTLRGNEEPCGSSTSDVWKLCRMWPFEYGLLIAESGWNVDFVATSTCLTQKRHMHKIYHLAAISNSLLENAWLCTNVTFWMLLISPLTTQTTCFRPVTFLNKILN